MKNASWIFLFYCIIPIFGQESETQKWVDYSLSYPFGSNYNLKYDAAYKTTTWQGEWRSIENSISIGRKLGPKITTNFSILIASNRQTDDYNTLEIRPSLGLKYHFSRKRRYILDLYTQFENRHIKNREEDTWTQTNRLRIRPELVVPITRRLENESIIWYSVAEAEWFATLKDQEERYANRFRTSLGLGYKFKEAWKFELIYVWQLSKNTIDEDFNTSSNIIRFRIKNSFQKSSKEKNKKDQIK